MRILDRARPQFHGIYRVSGRRAYRGHEPGEIFPALLEREAERRALERGDIELLERLIPALAAGSFKLPRGWLRKQNETKSSHGTERGKRL